MLRKTKISAVLLFVFSTPGFCSGFYLGAGVGPEYASFKKDSHFVQGINANVIDKSQLSGWGTFGSIFGGYGWIHKSFYLAGELNANVSSVNSHSSNSEYVHQTFSSTDYKMKHSYGISVIPGYLFSPITLFYARLGYTNSNFKISTSDASLANIDTNLDGFRFGAGIKQTISEKLAVRLECSQVNYQRKSMRVIVSPVITKTTKINPQTGQVEFGLIYNFA
ncbi:MAG: outer membrane beta-barrel protein [Gammaproteobacteria bacterium]